MSDNPLEMLRRARVNAASNSTNEARAINENPSLQELFIRRQDVLAKMNAAKVKAVAEAVKPFQNQLLEIDQQYSMLMTMLGDNSEEQP